ncbi:MAG: molecular chaperone DnaK, partial [Planctomycetales bacterium]
PMPPREVIIGIDLGTTNSVVAVMEGGEPKIIPNSEGQRTTPSVVAFQKDGETLVGEAAKRQAATQPSRTIASVKRIMGRRMSELPEEQELVPYKLTGGRDNYAQVKIGDRLYRPAEISAHILRKLKAAAEDYLGTTVRQAVITTPAYFNDAQRAATKDAGVIAGLDVKRIVNEPTAAALAYGLDKHKNEKIAVFDFGGGTFDISILDVSDGVFDVISTNVDTRLGGDDVDALLVNYVANEFQEQTGIDLRKDKLAVQRLQEACEKTKRELSTAHSAQVMLPFIAADAAGAKHLETPLSRAKFEGLIDHLVERCRGPVLQSLADARMEPSDIDQVVLVGGSTRIPKVQQFVEDLFGRKPHKGVNPDEVVAGGAAVQGGVLEGKVSNIVLLDVTPLSLGVETVGSVMSFIVERNAKVPIRMRRIFTTADDYQTSVAVRVFQGEREVTAGNRLLGEFFLDDIPAEPKGKPQIEVAFDIDANGLLNVSARHTQSGLEQRIRIEQTGGMQPEEIDRLRQNAEQHARDDRNMVNLIDARNRAQRVFHDVDRLYQQNANSVPDHVRRKVDDALNGARGLMESDDARKIEELIKGLKVANQMLLENLSEDITQSIASIFKKKNES